LNRCLRPQESVLDQRGYRAGESMTMGFLFSLFSIRCIIFSQAHTLFSHSKLCSLVSWRLNWRTMLYTFPFWVYSKHLALISSRAVCNDRRAQTDRADPAWSGSSSIRGLVRALRSANLSVLARFLPLLYNSLNWKHEVSPSATLATGSNTDEKYTQNIIWADQNCEVAFLAICQIFKHSFVLRETRHNTHKTNLNKKDARIRLTRWLLSL
jgi:hypothetical protein